MKTRVLHFAHEKSTKNTERFAEQLEEGQPPVIGSLYVQKFAVGNAKSLTVTIEIRE
jgi:hypothetical protein